MPALSFKQLPASTASKSSTPSAHADDTRELFFSMTMETGFAAMLSKMAGRAIFHNRDVPYRGIGRLPILNRGIER